MNGTRTALRSHGTLLLAALAALGAALGAGCSTPARSALSVDRSVLLIDRPAPRENCRIAHTPHPLPSLAQLADSAQLAAALSRFARQNPIREGRMHALYSVAFDADGRLAHLKSLDYWLPQGKDAEVGQLVRQHLRRPASGPWSVRLRVEAGGDGEPAFRVGRSEYCPPMSRTRFKLQAPTAVQLQKPQPVRLRLLVSAEGRVRSSEILSSSGDTELDRWVRETLERQEFSPALLDGVPVEREHEERVEIQARP
jgi:TonB family protein